MKKSVDWYKINLETTVHKHYISLLNIEYIFNKISTFQNILLFIFKKKYNDFL